MKPWSGRWKKAKQLSRAYLLAFFKEGELDHVGTYSDSAKTITRFNGDEVQEIVSFSGSTYQKAENKLLHAVKNASKYKQYWEWVDPSFEAHDKRYEKRMEKIKYSLS
jgi:hypothetical protein